MKLTMGSPAKCTFGDGRVPVSGDWWKENGQAGESRFWVEQIRRIAPEDFVDVGLLFISGTGKEDQAPPVAISLMPNEEIKQLNVEPWMAVIGYPGYNNRNDTHDKQHIFDNIYNVKRLAPAQVTEFVGCDLLNHDAATLGGSSRSVVVDLESGKALVLHFGSIVGQHNAVHAPHVSRIADARAGAG